MDTVTVLEGKKENYNLRLTLEICVNRSASAKLGTG